MSDKVYKVFLSSTAKDLAVHRAAAAEAIGKLRGFQCVRMEDFGALDAAAEDYCPQAVRDCDVFVILLGLCHGSRPAGSTKSYTEGEHDAAVEAGRSRLLFFTPENFAVDGSILMAEGQEGWRAQKDFRLRALGKRIAAKFDDPMQLGRDVAAALANWRSEHTPSPVGSDAAPGQVFRLDDFTLGPRHEPRIVQGVRPRPHDPLEGCFMERPVLLERAIAKVRETKERLVASSARPPVPIFWLAGPSGAGKSVLLLEVMRGLVVRRYIELVVRRIHSIPLCRARRYPAPCASGQPST